MSLHGSGRSSFGALCMSRSLIGGYFFAELWVMCFFSTGILNLLL